MTEPKDQDNQTAIADGTAVPVSETEARADPPTAPRRGGRLPWILLLAVLAFAAGGVAFFLVWPTVAPWLPAGFVARLQPDSGASAARLTALEQRLGAVENQVEAAAPAAALAALGERLGALEGAQAQALDRLRADLAEIRRAKVAQPAPDTQTSARLSALETKLDGLARRLDTVATSVPATTPDNGDTRLRETIARLGRRIEELQDRLATTEAAVGSTRGGARETGLVLAVTELYRTTRGAGPYGETLAVVTGFGAAGPEIDVLARHAETGVRTQDQLKDRFPDVAAAALRATRLPKDSGWFGRAVNRLGELVSVRRVGERAGDDAEAAIARAEVRLGTGDLGAALDELATLAGPAAAAFADWRAAAQARRAVDQAVQALQRSVVAGLAPATD